MRFTICSKIRRENPVPAEIVVPEGGIPGVLDDDRENLVRVTAILERTAVVQRPGHDKELVRLDRVRVQVPRIKITNVHSSMSELRRKQAATGRAKARIARAQNKAARLATAAA